MQYLILRRLNPSDIGFFHACRKKPSVTSKQRAIAVEAAMVDALFPAARKDEDIQLNLQFLGDGGKIKAQTQVLRLQQRNWRIAGDSIKDRHYAFVESKCIMALYIDTKATPATGSWAVFPRNDGVEKQLLGSPFSSNLVDGSMVLLNGVQMEGALSFLHSAVPALFRKPAVSLGASQSSVAQKNVNAVVIRPDPLRTMELFAQTNRDRAGAVADVVDNSISAGASNIQILMPKPGDGNRRWMAIVDDGSGMDEKELATAMMLGSPKEYQSRDLGKYGYGLKGASWSQAEKVTVVSKRRDGTIVQLTWDKEHIRAAGEWAALRDGLEAWQDELITKKIGAHGTAIIWSDLRPVPMIRRARTDQSSPWEAEQQDLFRHLGVVFHRFLEGKAQGRSKTTITIEGKGVSPLDPMLASHSLTDQGSVEQIQIPLIASGGRIRFQSYILPSEPELFNFYASSKETAHEVLRQIGIDGRRNESQGFYIYRNDRLIQWGGWHTLFTNDEHTKLLRVVLDFDESLDAELEVDITKRSVTFPFSLAETLKLLLKKPRVKARERYGSKVEQPTTGQAPPPAGTGLQPKSPPAPVPQAQVEVPQPSVQQPVLPNSSVGASSPIPSLTPPQVSPGSKTQVRAVQLQGRLWKIGKSVGGGGRILQLHDDPRLLALTIAIQNKPEAAAALGDLLSAVDVLLPDASEKLKEHFGKQA